MIQRSKLGLKFFFPAFSTPCLSSGPVNRSDGSYSSKYGMNRMGHGMIRNSSRTKWSSIWSVIIRVINKIGGPQSSSPI